MTQEEKELLLKDLCAKLPYNVIVKHLDTNLGSEGNLINICILYEITTTIIDEEGDEDVAFLAESKPYLRPMSSMTEKEKEYVNTYICGDTSQELLSLHYVDFLNSHHFDYRGLIEKGLALEAPKEMYNYG